MRLVTLGSSSRGNCYLLGNGEECLVVECGVRWEEVRKALGFRVSGVAGCLVSHEHQDHARCAAKALGDFVPLLMSRGTAESLGTAGNRLVRVMEPMRRYDTGGFRVFPFPVEHDAAEPFGFLIWHRECGNVLFATDTWSLRYRFPNLNSIMIECNYGRDILERNVREGLVPQAQLRRTVRSHMSYGTCLETLLANDLGAVARIVLLHLSDGNSDEEAFRDGIAEATGKTVLVARAGMETDFGKEPY